MVLAQLSIFGIVLILVPLALVLPSQVKFTGKGTMEI